MRIGQFAQNFRKFIVSSTFERRRNISITPWKTVVSGPRDLHVTLLRCNSTSYCAVKVLQHLKLRRKTPVRHQPPPQRSPPLPNCNKKQRKMVSLSGPITKYSRNLATQCPLTSAPTTRPNAPPPQHQGPPSSALQAEPSHPLLRGPWVVNDYCLIKLINFIISIFIHISL